MVTKGPGERLLGRRVECGVLDRLLVAAREGHGGALVVHGQPGVGKTALLDFAIASADGFRVAYAVGVESEMELPFSALQQLCGPMLDRLDVLPSPQRTGLRVAFGLNEGERPDRFLVGLAVLSLLSEVAGRQPLLCVVDDAQWLDRASALALAFVARRLLAEPIALVFAARELSEELRGIDGLLVEGLGEADTRALLGAAARTRLDDQVVERIVAETNGNPLALLELPRGLTPAQLAGGFGLPVALPLAERIEDSFTRRLVALPSDTQRLLLVAAAEPVGDTALVWRAAERLGVGNSAAEAAESEGLLDLGAGVSFRHPLVRSAAYRAASPSERREAHEALAEATDPGTDPDRRAWHHAQATTGPDEDVAQELERSADRAYARGGFAAAAAFLERSTALTPEPGRRASRALAAAQAKRQAGAPDAALRLVATAESGPLGEFQRARVDVIRAQISFASNRGSDAPSLLLKAAKRLEALDAGLAREIYLDALSAALFAGRFARSSSVVDAAKAARSASSSQRPPSAWDLLLDGLTVLITEGPAVGVPTLKRALGVLRDEPVGALEGLRWLWLAGRAAGFVWDYDTWDALTSRQIQLARDAGALTVLPMTLSTRSVLHLLAGELPVAASLVEEANAIIDATDSRTVPYAPLTLAAFRGREAEASRLIQASTKDFIARGEGLGLTHAQWATAALYNGLARYEDALATAQQAYEDPRELWFSTWAAVELIEAASRSGKHERATNALDTLAEATRAAGTD